ncbi:MAG TPA: GDP-mannose 4,6-dehydratase [Candidatus Acidoferrales bacterium]|nr:GDP-mannose 4,6-dehydratase [Candidatus Acidoferrales bacterium]
MRALITGGAGFIGSHLAEALIARGDDVFILDDLSTGSVENIRHLKASEKFHYAFDSLQNRHLLAEMVDESDVVFHLAAAVGVRLIVESPVRTIETNVNGTQLVLDAANKKKKLVLVASTSEVYGKSKEVPFREDSDLVLGPTTKGRWSYAASKALDEFLALSYWKEKQLPIVVVRFFNTVGPRQTGRYGMVLPNFVSQALENAPITIFGTGQQSRCFCDVQDSVQSIVRLVDSGKAVGEVINVGTDEEVTIEGLARVVKQRTHSSSAITHTPYDEAYEPGFEDMLRRVPSLEKLERITGFRPRTPLNTIVDRVIAHFREKEKSAASNGDSLEEPVATVQARAQEAR